MQDDLKQLIQLQELDQTLDQLRLALKKIPLRIEEIKAQIKQIQQQFEDKKKRFLSLQVARKNKEMELASQEEKIRKHETELNAVKSNEAYKALLTEIEAAKKEMGTIEDAILHNFEEADQLNLELKKDEVSLKEEQKKLEQEISELESQIQKAEKALRDELQNRENFIHSLKKELLSVYEYIREKKGGVAIVTIEGECCSGCNTHLTPNTINEVKKGKNMVRCDDCSRILFETTAVAAAEVQN